MKNYAKIICVTAIILFVSLTVSPQKRGPSTPQERDTAIKAAHLLETQPLSKDAKKVRQWFTNWLIEVPDVSVTICPGYMKPLYASKGKNYAAEISFQMTFSSAAFIVEHPDQAKDRTAVNLAGLEGSLKSYEAILKEKPNARWEFLDGLIAKRDKGELKAYVEEVARTECTTKR